MVKALCYLDRGAVLFVGMVAGAVIAMSFQSDGKPFAALLAGPDAPYSAPQPALAAAPPVTCHDNFPVSPRSVEARQSGRPLRIGIFGDSFGDGVWSAAAQVFHDRRAFTVYQLSQEGTGFTRYNSLNLLEDVQHKLARQPIDIALINFGANDTQAIWAHGAAAPYMSKPWQTVIGGRAGALVHYLQSQGVAVGWIGLPRMRKPGFDRDIQAMNGFYAGLMCQLHVPFINPEATSADKQHQYARELIDPDTKTPYIARADDGIHMSVHGYRVIAWPLFKQIRTFAGQDDTEQNNTGQNNIGQSSRHQQNGTKP